MAVLVIIFLLAVVVILGAKWTIEVERQIPVIKYLWPWLFFIGEDNKFLSLVVLYSLIGLIVFLIGIAKLK